MTKGIRNYLVYMGDFENLSYGHPYLNFKDNAHLPHFQA